MLPQVIPESDIRIFRFWFDNRLQDGLHYANELYFLAKVQASSKRAHLYQLACKLTEQGADVVITAGHHHYRLWINLRNQKLAAMSLQQHTQMAARLMAAPASDVTRPASNASQEGSL